MKYFRIKITRSTNPGGGTHYDYPAFYDAKKIKFGPSYETFNPSKITTVKGRTADPHEMIVVGVSDADAAQFTNPPVSVSIPEAAFKTDLDSNDPPPVASITAPEKVVAILDKVHKNLDLTPADREAIDPDHASPGVTKKPSTRARLDKFKIDNPGI